MSRIELYETSEVAQAVDDFANEYVEVAKGKEEMNRNHSAILPSENGYGYTWNDSVAEYVETNMGFRRYFTLELSIMKGLFDLISELPYHWGDYDILLYRSGKTVTPISAAKSAILGAAFNVQNSMLRICSNHAIQSLGGEITKDLQYRMWGLQPVGIGEFHVRLQNIHDELLCVCKPELSDTLTEIQKQFLEDYRSLVPLIAMGWKDGKNWKKVH